MKKHLVTLVAVLVAALGLGLGTGAASGADRHEKPYRPHPKTIVDVSGSRLDGFRVRRYDGSVEELAPSREQRIGCRSGETQLDRVRCRTEIRVWSSALGDLRRSLNYTQALERR